PAHRHPVLELLDLPVQGVGLALAVGVDGRFHALALALQLGRRVVRLLLVQLLLQLLHLLFALLEEAAALLRVGSGAGGGAARGLGCSPTKVALVIPKVITSPSLSRSRSTSLSLTKVPLVDPRSMRKYSPSSHQIFACLEETPASPMRMLQAEERPTVIGSGVSSISWFSRDPFRMRNDGMEAEPRGCSGVNVAGAR